MVDTETLPSNPRRIVVIVGGTAAIAAIQFALGMRSSASQIAHVFLGATYLAPIVLAASWFGWRAGVLCAMATAVVHGVHVAADWPADLLLGTTQAVQMSVFVVVAGIVGTRSGRAAAGASTASGEHRADGDGSRTSVLPLDRSGPRSLAGALLPEREGALSGGRDASHVHLE